MNAKKNLCAMIPADLHAKVIAEKEQLALSTLGEYVELVLKEPSKEEKRSWQQPKPWHSKSLRNWISG